MCTERQNTENGCREELRQAGARAYDACSSVSPALGALCSPGTGGPPSAVSPCPPPTSSSFSSFPSSSFSSSIPSSSFFSSSFSSFPSSSSPTSFASSGVVSGFSDVLSLYSHCPFYSTALHLWLCRARLLLLHLRPRLSGGICSCPRLQVQKQTSACGYCA